jgi:3-hydroxyacyl-CoA dehydrogenase
MTLELGITSVGVVGSGTMGGGIAMAFANAGFPVTIVDASDEALQRGLSIIRTNYTRSVERGRLGAAEAGERIARIAGSTELADLADADIVTEAIFEDMDAKLDLFGRLDGIVRADAVLATNTSTLDVDRIAAASARPERVLGMHYFSPANVMKLLEIVRGARTAPEVVEKASRLGVALGKVPVVVGVCFGFVGNRMLFARAAESERALLEGSTPMRNDAALTTFGFPMGQHEMMDLSGLDVEWRIRQPRGEKRPVSDRLYAMNRWGQKTGAGFYRYDKGSRVAMRDSEVEAICRELGAALGYAQREFGDEELLERQLFPLVNEGVHILDEGIAGSAADIDAIWRHGYGWPVDRVGPMAWAETIGAARLCDGLERFSREARNPAPRPAASLKEAARRGASLAAVLAERRP